MKNNWHFSALLVFLISSCINGEQTYQVDYTNLLCGGNSKVWELEQVKTADKQTPRFYTWGQGVFVFYFSGKVAIGSLEDFVNKKTDLGTYKFDQTTQILSIKVAGELWKFHVRMDAQGKLGLKTIIGKGLSDYMQLVPLREPNKL